QLQSRRMPRPDKAFPRKWSSERVEEPAEANHSRPKGKRHWMVASGLPGGARSRNLQALKNLAPLSIVSPQVSRSSGQKEGACDQNGDIRRWLRRLILPLNRVFTTKRVAGQARSGSRL